MASGWSDYAAQGRVKRKDAAPFANRAFPVWMVILFCPSVAAQEYYSHGKQNLFPTLHTCPRCHAHDSFWLNGFYQRNVITESAMYRIYVRRLRCKRCGVSVSMLPSFALPRYQYAAHVVIAALLLRLAHGLSLMGAALALKLSDSAPSPSIPLIAHYHHRFSDHEKLVEIMTPALGAEAASCPLAKAVAVCGSPVGFNLKYSEIHGTTFLARI